MNSSIHDWDIYNKVRHDTSNRLMPMERKDISGKPHYPSFTPSMFVPPLLHMEIGLVNNVWDDLCLSMDQFNSRSFTTWGDRYVEGTHQGIDWMTWLNKYLTGLMKVFKNAHFLCHCTPYSMCHKVPYFSFLCCLFPVWVCTCIHVDSQVAYM